MSLQMTLYKALKLGGLGACPLRKNLKIKCSEIEFCINFDHIKLPNTLNITACCCFFCRYTFTIYRGLITIFFTLLLFHRFDLTHRRWKQGGRNAMAPLRFKASPQGCNFCNRKLQNHFNLVKCPPYFQQLPFTTSFFSTQNRSAYVQMYL